MMMLPIPIPIPDPASIRIVKTGMQMIVRVGGVVRPQSTRTGMACDRVIDHAAGVCLMRVCLTGV